VANRIVVLSRRLIAEIQRYERYAWLCRQVEEEEEGEDEETGIF
jgi:hypothetical protein